MMTSYDNGPALEGWTVPEGRHAGDYCWGLDCPVCGSAPLPMPDCVLGEN